MLGEFVVTKRKFDGESEIYERQAAICKAFANPTRLHLIEMLARGERWATELQQGLGISKANLSQHLAILKSAGLVATRREGKQLHCGIAMQEVKQATTAFRNMLKAQGKESRRWS
jgi:ArsR family transcriptional regulator